MSRRKLWLLCLPSLAIFPFASRQACAAQTPSATSNPSASDDQDEKPRPYINLRVEFSENGEARVAFSSLGLLASTPHIDSVVGNALGCSLQSTSRSYRSVTSLLGTCRIPLSGSRFSRQARLNLVPLADFARAQKIDRVSLNLRLPDSEFADSQPPAEPNPLLTDKIPAKYRKRIDQSRSYSWLAASQIPDTINVSFGYRKDSVQRGAAALIAVLLAPLVFIFWLGRKALSAQTQDKTVVWFSYMRCLQWALNGALIGWWILAESIQLPNFLKFLASTGWLRNAWESPVTPAILEWIPPSIVWVLCFALSHPVQQKLRGLTWTRREIALQGAFSVCSSLFPVAMFLMGLQTLGTSNTQWAAIWFLSGFLTLIFAGRALRKVMGTEPQALSTGELRDHAFAMAKHLGAKLQQVYVIPSGKGQMANAFARTGNTIAFTDFLLQRMSRREVNYILGHELTHLKLGHPGKLASARILSIFGAIMFLSFFSPMLFDSIILRYSIILAIVTFVPLFWSRRFEYAADEGAVAATGDPQAAIAALFKLSSLNMMPFHWSRWSEKWLTHPSALRRAHAIARKAGIPESQVTEIARQSATPPDCYTLPSTVTPGAKILSSQRKQNSALRGAFSMLAAIIFTPAICASVAGLFSSHPTMQQFILWAGLPITVVAYLLFLNFVPVTGLTTLVAALKQKLVAQNIKCDAWEGIPVGFAPAAVPRLYELNTNWDIGCLFLRSDRLCYWGEEIQFALRRDQITSIALGPGVPGLLRPVRVYLAWKDSETGASGVLNWGCIDGASTLQLRRKTSEFGRILHLWWKSSAESRQLPTQFAGLSVPRIGAVTGANPRSGWKAGKITKELVYTGLFAIIGAMLCGLPFHLLAYLASSSVAALTQQAPFRSPGAGWYVVSVALLMRCVGLYSVLRYREKPAVEVAPAPQTSKGTLPVRENETRPKPVEETSLVR